MRAHCGNTRVTVPDAWRDDSSYVFESPDGEFGLTLDRLQIEEPTTLDAMLDDREESMTLDGVRVIRRELSNRNGRDLGLLELEIERDDFGPGQYLFVMVCRLGPEEAVNLVLRGPSRRQAELTRIWVSVLDDFEGPVEEA